MVLWKYRNCRNKYGSKLIDSATKTGKKFTKTAGKRVINKTAEATGDLVGNKISDKITKPRSKKKKKKPILWKKCKK